MVSLRGCIASSGPGATNLVTAIADAKLDSIPFGFALRGKVSSAMIGTDAFQEVDTYGMSIPYYQTQLFSTRYRTVAGNLSVMRLDYRQCQVALDLYGLMYLKIFNKRLSP